jgi:hypothetical protein
VLISRLKNNYKFWWDTNTAGNVQFRETVASIVERYLTAEKRVGKPAIVKSIIDGVHASGGRFLKHEQKSNRVRCRFVSCVFFVSRKALIFAFAVLRVWYWFDFVFVLCYHFSLSTS